MTCLTRLDNKRLVVAYLAFRVCLVSQCKEREREREREREYVKEIERERVKTVREGDSMSRSECERVK